MKRKNEEACRLSVVVLDVIGEEVLTQLFQEIKDGGGMISLSGHLWPLWPIADFITGTMTNPDVSRGYPKPKQHLLLSPLGLPLAFSLLGVFSWALYFSCAGQRGPYEVCCGTGTISRQRDHFPGLETTEKSRSLGKTACVVSGEMPGDTWLRLPDTNLWVQRNNAPSPCCR